MTLPMHVAARLTTAEFLALDEAPPGLRFELLDGELVTMNSPAAAHQHAVLRIGSALLAWVDVRGAAGGFVVIDIATEAGVDTVFRPDVTWFAAGRDIGIDTALPLPVGDVVVEVRSPATAGYDRTTKRARYLAHGASELWLVDPTAPSAIVVTGEGERLVETTLESPLLPGFSLALADLGR